MKNQKPKGDPVDLLLRILVVVVGLIGIGAMTMQAIEQVKAW